MRWVIPAGTLAILFVLGLVVALSMVRQRSAIVRIEALGGGVVQTPVGPDWLREWSGPEWARFVDEVDFIYFKSDEVTYKARFPKNVVQMGGCPWTTGSTIDDPTLSVLACFPRLKALDLSWTKISDAGVLRLSGLTELEELRLEGTDISDASVPTLAGFRQLKVLLIRNTKISDAKCEELRSALSACEVVAGSY